VLKPKFPKKPKPIANYKELWEEAQKHIEELEDTILALNRDTEADHSEVILATATIRMYKRKIKILDEQIARNKK